MKQFIGHDSNRVGAWICKQFGTTWIPNSGSAFGLEVDGELIAGVLFEGCNGASVRMHIAAVEGTTWADREFLWLMFAYPFLQLRVKRIIGLIDSTNMKSRAWAVRIGAKHEATLADCSPTGDLCLYTLAAADCSWLHRKPRKFNYL